MWNNFCRARSPKAMLALYFSRNPSQGLDEWRRRQEWKAPVPFPGDYGRESEVPLLRLTSEPQKDKRSLAERGTWNAIDSWH